MAIKPTNESFSNLMAEHEDIAGVVKLMLINKHDPLEICIAKYQYILDNELMEYCGIPECALCQKHNMGTRLNVDNLPDCEGCIIFKHTGRYCCEATPYTELEYALDDDDEDDYKDAIEREIKFLTKLWNERENNGN